MGVSKPALTVGADPEMFLEQNGFLRSAIDRIGGSKSAPRPLSKEGYFVQEDNVAVELNIPPARTAQEFIDSLEWGKKAIEEEVKAFGYTLSPLASALFPPNELLDIRSLVFGCDPDYNAWKKGKRNPKPKASNARLRTCGGHVHVGYPQSENVSKLRLIQLMDLYLGVPSVLMDDDVGRRELYGKAGAYRDQPYGAEYRVLSNFWLREPKYERWVFEQTARAYEAARGFGKPSIDVKPDDYSRFMETGDLSDDIRQAINKSDLALAQNLVGKYDLTLV